MDAAATARPLPVIGGNTGSEPLAGMLLHGSAGSNTAAGSDLAD
jgi:hypothetical protein